jgi:hypothetical protein
MSTRRKNRSTGRKDMSTLRSLYTIPEDLSDDEIVRREQEREKERWKARTPAERERDALAMANEVAQQEYHAYEIEQRKIREQEAEQAIADTKKRREAYLREEGLKELRKKGKKKVGCMGFFGSCAMGATRKRKPKSKKKRKPNSKKKRKPNSKKKRKPRATTNKRRNTRTGR